MQLADGAELDDSALAEHAGNFIARYKLPKRVVFVDELPRNTMGKVQKAMLRSLYGSLYTAAPPAGRP